MQVGNKSYRIAADIPEQVPVFPLSGALLLPGAQLPLNIFEPRYLAMFDDALSSHRVIGIIQPALERAVTTRVLSRICVRVGCLGRITSFGETGDGRYVITLGGICRFRVLEESEPGRQQALQDLPDFTRSWV
jgi:Lon protease-like protein